MSLSFYQVYLIWSRPTPHYNHVRHRPDEGNWTKLILDSTRSPIQALDPKRGGRGGTPLVAAVAADSDGLAAPAGCAGRGLIREPHAVERLGQYNGLGAKHRMLPPRRCP